MTRATPDIDEIVREVLRRLDAMSAPGQESERNSVLEVSQNVVAVADVEGRLDGMSAVAVRPRAVVTPAARDYLNDRNVALTFSVGQACSKSIRQRILVGIDGSDRGARELVAGIDRAEADCQTIEKSGLVELIDSVADYVRTDGRGGVLLTADTAAAVCLANRSTHVRASLAASACDAKAARTSIAANVLIVDPRKTDQARLRAILREFAKPEGSKCPAEYRRRLGM